MEPPSPPFELNVFSHVWTDNRISNANCLSEKKMTGVFSMIYKIYPRFLNDFHEKLLKKTFYTQFEFILMK